jgi:serine protease Do
MARSAGAEDLGANRPDLIRAVLPTVVNISVKKQDPAPPATPVSTPANSKTPVSTAGPEIKSFVGSGFVIDPSGIIVTNYHVVEDAFSIMVTFSDGSTLPGKTLSASRTADLALVEVKPDHPLPAAHWGDSDKLQVGDQVFAAGNPFGLGLSVSAGIVSALNRDIQNSPYDDLIQTDATINHGNSGGPLFDMQGNVVGVDSALISPTRGSVGLGFAVPASSARFVLDRLRTYGWVRPGWIGVKVQQVTPDIAEATGMMQPQGAIVAWVLPDGPAQKAGLAVGDVILRFNGNPPSDERALLRSILRTQVGDTVVLSVRRAGAEQELPVVVGEWPRDQWDKRDAPMQAKRPKIVIPPDLGLSLAPVAKNQRGGLGLEDGLDGVMVTGVAANSDAAQRGMTSGDVILRVQDKTVATPAEVQAGIDAAKAAKRDHVLMLILPKVRDVPGPKWVALDVVALD